LVPTLLVLVFGLLSVSKGQASKNHANCKEDKGASLKNNADKNFSQEQELESIKVILDQLTSGVAISVN